MTDGGCGNLLFVGSAREKAEEHDSERPVEALMRDVDLSLLHGDPGTSLRPQERLDQLIEMQRFASQLVRAGRKPPRRAR